MRLYVVRHGEAEAKAASDAERPLTARGRQEVDRLWKALRGEGIQVRHLVSSPYLRARQTADQIAGHFPGVARSECPCITPDDSVSGVLDWLAAAAPGEGWVLVSHMPLVAILTGFLTEGAGARIPFGVGTVACIDLEVLAQGGGRLLWLRSPDRH